MRGYETRESKTEKDMMYLASSEVKRVSQVRAEDFQLVFLMTFLKAS